MHTDREPSVAKKNHTHVKSIRLHPELAIETFPSQTSRLCNRTRCRTMKLTAHRSSEGDGLRAIVKIYRISMQTTLLVLAVGDSSSKPKPHNRCPRESSAQRYYILPAIFIITIIRVAAVVIRTDSIDNARHGVAWTQSNGNMRLIH